MQIGVINFQNKKSWNALTQSYRTRFHVGVFDKDMSSKVFYMFFYPLCFLGCSHTEQPFHAGSLWKCTLQPGDPVKAGGYTGQQM